MGIFTKRDVVKGEEITFNYNVDRYGWVQPYQGSVFGVLIEVVTTHSRAIVVNPIVSARSVVRHRRMSALSMIFSLRVSTIEPVVVPRKLTLP